jgi:hypothetical protein
MKSQIHRFKSALTMALLMISGSAFAQSAVADKFK